MATAEGESQPKWLIYLVLAAVTIVLVLQKTKQALLPAKQTPILWAAEFVTLAGVLVLASGWARDSGWADEQARLGTLANNFYPPRREAMINGGAIGLGVLGALWWATTTWAVVFTGMRRGVPGRGLIDFTTAACMGAITGGVIGAVAGLVIGHVWEARHRRHRMNRGMSNA